MEATKDSVVMISTGDRQNRSLAKIARTDLAWRRSLLDALGLARIVTDASASAGERSRRAQTIHLSFRICFAGCARKNTGSSAETPTCSLSADCSSRQWDHHLPRRASRLEHLSAHATEVNTRLVLPNDFLFKVDTASMKESLEIRVPMLDEDLFAFGLSLPHCLKVNGRTCKRVLREVAKRRLPEAVANKPKQGFGIPVDTWVDADFKGRLRDTLLGPSTEASRILPAGNLSTHPGSFLRESPVARHLPAGPLPTGHHVSFGSLGDAEDPN